ncbi:ABC transporter ATP-binding protein [Hymenobacter sp. BT439]|uniref:ABC transporter ATP-binding protein n=1 Tax=Hymenobacter properus TaxID=2791026 RepID=A0A931BEW9_9BACT|nr:ABC transporter ATP-binding protein [Hymenobacter properus]
MTDVALVFRLGLLCRVPASPPPVIRVSHLRKHFGAHAVVQDVSFELAVGETLVLLGPSGCGKTTLLKMLNRLIEPDGGSVEINGRDVRQQPAETLRRGMGYVIQQVGLLPHYTVAENIGVVPRLLGHAPAAIAARTEALLTRLHLPPARYAGQLPQQLSGGQQQRVGLARALAADPPIVLMDEPFGALDPITRAGIRREFRELEELRSKTVVLVTHDVAEAFELADRILLLNAGRVQQLGTPRELLFRPANDFVRYFFAAERLALQLRTLTLDDVFDNEFLHDANPHTTVHEALETLTGTAVGTTGRFSVAQLMAAFGAALQREEDAWKR